VTTFTQTYRGVTLGAGFVQPQTTYESISSVGAVREVGANFVTDGGATFVANLAGNGAGRFTPELTAVRVNTLAGTGERRIGTAKNLDFGGLGGAIGWARWTDGTTQGTGVTGRTMSTADNIHYVFGGNPTGTMPTGRASYQLAGGTTPAQREGALTGTMKGELVIDFGTAKVGWDMLLAIAADRFTFITAGGLAAPSIGLVQADGGRVFSGTGDVTSEKGRCVGCTGQANGFVSGPGGAYVGLNYTIGTADYGAVSGVAAFQKVP
jgi:hypothetical protein